MTEGRAQDVCRRWQKQHIQTELQQPCSEVMYCNTRPMLPCLLQVPLQCHTNLHTNLPSFGQQFCSHVMPQPACLFEAQELPQLFGQNTKYHLSPMSAQ